MNDNENFFNAKPEGVKEGGKKEKMISRISACENTVVEWPNYFSLFVPMKRLFSFLFRWRVKMKFMTEWKTYEYLRLVKPLGLRSLQKWGWEVGQSTWKLGLCRMSKCHCSAAVWNSSCRLITSATIGSSISSPLCAWSFDKRISCDAVGETNTTRFLLVWRMLAMTSRWLYLTKLSRDFAINSESSVSSLNDTTKPWGTHDATNGLRIFGTSSREIFGAPVDWILCFGMSSSGT